MHTRQDNSFGILMYHRVAPRIAGVPRPTWNVTPERFRRQLTGLLSRGYRPWPLQRALACRGAGEPVPPRTFVVTFDDGYECVYDNAWPILRELSVPATVFLVTSCLDTDGPVWFDDWVAAGSDGMPAAIWKPLCTAHCAEMIEHGLVEVGSHTHTHGHFLGRTEAFREDLTRSLIVLHNTFGIEHASFAFPFGDFDPDLAAAVRQSGAGCALTTESRRVAPLADPFSWGRLTVVERDTPVTLTLKLNGWYSALQGACRWLRRPWETGRALFGRQMVRPQPPRMQTPTPNKTVSP